MKVNQQIKSSSVRLIDQEGKQIGVVPFSEALERAREAELDLVEIVSNSSPSVCKIMDYNRYRYSQQQKVKLNRKSQKQTQSKLKEIRIKPNISDNDYECKLRKAREFLEKNCKVKLTCLFRGRQITYKEKGLERLKTFCQSLETIAVQDSPIKFVGKMFSTMLSPLSNKVRATHKEKEQDGRKELKVEK